MSADETHKDIDGNLVRPFWCHAQIEEENADFHGTVGDQSMGGQASLRKQYPNETVIIITKAYTICKRSFSIHQGKRDANFKYEPSGSPQVGLVSRRRTGVCPFHTCYRQ